MKKIIIMMFLMLLMTLSACDKGEEKMEKNPVATINVKGYEEAIVLELYYDVAPNTVKNFIYLADKEFYKGAIFHRVIKYFMIQGGAGDGTAKPIVGEFTSNGYKNDLLHERGVISMARTNVKNSATSQFFIVHKDSPHLNGEYAAFGKMVSGYETLDAIAAAATDHFDRPIVDVVIESVSIEKFGNVYDSPNFI